MKEDMPPKLLSYALICNMGLSAREIELRRSYNWKMTPEGWLRMDKKRPSTPKNLPAPEFLGQCFDEDEDVWMRCFEVEKDGSIDSADTSFHRVRNVAGDVDIDLDKVCLTTLTGFACFLPKLTSYRLCPL